MNLLGSVQLVYSEELYRVPGRTVIIIPGKWEETRKDERSLLEKILAAVGLSLSGVKIVQSVSPDVALWVDKPERVIAFGCELPGISKNELFEVRGTKMILTSSLDSLRDDDAEKKKLWVALRAMF